MAAMVAVGCGSDDDEGGGGGSDEPAAGEESGAKGKTVAIIAPFANPFQTDIRRGAEAVGKENGVEVIYLNFNANAQDETRYVSDVISRKVDAVIYGANDAKVSLAGFKRLKAAKIPVVCFDTCVEEQEQQEHAVAYVTSDNAALGKLSGDGAANYLKENVDGKAQVAFITCNTQAACRDRFEAQLESLKAVDYEEVDNQVAIESDKVKRTAEGIIQANPDLDLILTNGLPQTEGGTAAIKNLNSEAVLFGMDMTPVIAQALLDEKSPLQAAVGQDGNAIGTTMMQLAVDVLNGQTPSQFDHLIPGKLYSRDNLDEVQEYLDNVEE